MVRWLPSAAWSAPPPSSRPRLCSFLAAAEYELCLRHRYIWRVARGDASARHLTATDPHPRGDTASTTAGPQAVPGARRRGLPWLPPRLQRPRRQRLGSPGGQAAARRPPAAHSSRGPTPDNPASGALTPARWACKHPTPPNGPATNHTPARPRPDTPPAAVQRPDHGPRPLPSQRAARTRNGRGQGKGDQAPGEKDLQAPRPDTTTHPIRTPRLAADGGSSRRARDGPAHGPEGRRLRARTARALPRRSFPCARCTIEH